MGKYCSAIGAAVKNYNRHVELLHSGTAVQHLTVLEALRGKAG